MEAEPQENQLLEDEANGYPAYQLVVAVKDRDETLYHSSRKVESHKEGNKWIKDVLKAHPGTSSGKVSLSNKPKGTSWPVTP